VEDQVVQMEPIAVSCRRAAELIGCSRPSFYKHWIAQGWIRTVDLAGRGQCVLVSELRAAVEKRAADQASGAVVPPQRTGRPIGSPPTTGKKSLRTPS
jgi:hypothetical protein